MWNIAEPSRSRCGRIVGGSVGKTVLCIRLLPFIFHQTAIRGIAVASCTSFDRMNPFLDKHGIRPVIDHVYALGCRAVQAFEYLTRPGPFGKVIIKVDG